MNRILVVDDEPLIVEMIEDTLSSEGYEIIKAYSGEEGLLKIEEDLPDLVLLDLMLPGMDGYEVCRQMQSDVRFNHIPVIMLTAKSAIADRVAGYERGADDYITKPFTTDELVIRVRSQLHHLQHRERSEITGLPGSSLVEAEIERRTADPDDSWSIIYIDIDRFTAYNEVYSFAEGDTLIRQAADCLKQAVAEVGNSTDFVGHIGGDDFVVLSTPAKSSQITEKALQLFEQVAPNFFNEIDRQNQYFTFVNRGGEAVKLPLVTLSFDVVDNQ